MKLNTEEQPNSIWIENKGSSLIIKSQKLGHQSKQEFVIRPDGSWSKIRGGSLLDEGE